MAFAEFSSLIPEWVSLISQVGVGSIAIVLCWYLISKYIPATERRHADERREERIAFFQHLQLRDKQAEDQVIRLEKVIKDNSEAIVAMRIDSTILRELIEQLQSLNSTKNLSKKDESK